MQKELGARDETIQHQGTEIQRQTTEIEGLKADIVKKNEEVERCNQEITNQQITINELKAKLPSRDLMQVKFTPRVFLFANINFSEILILAKYKINSLICESL